VTPRQRLLAAVKGKPELVDRLLMVAEPPDGPVVYDPDSAYSILAPLLEGHATERFVVVALDRKNRVMATEVLTTGSDRLCVVDPKQVFRWALLQGRSGAAGVLLGHNHPSGDPTPSYQDEEVTRNIQRAGKFIGIPLIDHIIIAGGSFRRVTT
jgi:DNA repair protein RadC